MIESNLPVGNDDRQIIALQPGETLGGRFRIVRRQGRGGMGIVFEAFDEKLERRVALKCATAGFRNRLPPEVRTASEISHPNVCRTFEIHTAETRQGPVEFLTMEWLDGETLAARLRRGRLPEPEARAIALQVCAGLSEAHSKGVIHGDLKGANVILTKAADGATRAVITDFGLAHMPGTSHLGGRSGTPGGTPGYMAPEQKGGAKATAASDIYALGVMLYEMLAGRRPDTAAAVAASTVTMPTAVTSTVTMPIERSPIPGRREPGKAPPVHPKWDRIIARCLEIEPERRYKDAHEVAQALVPRTRKRVLAAVAAVALAAVTAAITHESATAPPESARLAVLPFLADAATAPLAGRVFQDLSGLASRIQGDGRTSFSAIPANRILRDKVDSAAKAQAALKATHVLHGDMLQGGKLTVHATVTNARTGVNLREWTAEYEPEQVRYIPRALAGVVTAALGLPALTDGQTVNDAARGDYQQGRELVRRDSKMDAAVAALERAVLADPDSALTHAGLAEARWWKYFLTKDRAWLDRAAESLRQSQLRDPDTVLAHLVAGILKGNAGQPAQAIEDYQRAIQLDPRNGDAYRRLGQAYDQNGQMQEAEAARLRATEIAPNDYRNFQSLGAFYFQRGKVIQASPPLARAVELAPEELGPRLALATAYKYLGRFSEAEQQLRQAIGLRETASTLHALGAVLAYQKKEREAISYYRRALDLDPRRYLTWLHLGICYRRLNQAGQSEHANRRGLELVEVEVSKTPRAGNTRSLLAYLCARLGQRRRAAMEIEQALQLSPADADTRWIAALTWEAMGRREAALDVLQSLPPDALADLNRWPDAEGLRKDVRFSELLAAHNIAKGE